MENKIIYACSLSIVLLFAWLSMKTRTGLKELLYDTLADDDSYAHQRLVAFVMAYIGSLVAGSTVLESKFGKCQIPIGLLVASAGLLPHLNEAQDLHWLRTLLYHAFASCLCGIVASVGILLSDQQRKSKKFELNLLLGVTVVEFVSIILPLLFPNSVVFHFLFPVFLSDWIMCFSAVCSLSLLGSIELSLLNVCFFKKIITFFFQTLLQK